MRHRTLGVGLRYAYPPARGVDVFEVTLGQLLVLRNEAKNLDVLRWIGRGISMPKKFVEEVAKRAGIEADKLAARLTEEEVEKIYSTVKSLVNDVSAGKNHQPVVIMQSDKPLEALPIMTEEAAKASTKKAVRLPNSGELHFAF